MIRNTIVLLRGRLTGRNLARVRRTKGVMGKGGKDVSHTKSGGFRMESVSKNRARNRGKA